MAWAYQYLGLRQGKIELLLRGLLQELFRHEGARMVHLGERFAALLKDEGQALDKLKEMGYRFKVDPELPYYAYVVEEVTPT